MVLLVGLGLLAGCAGPIAGTASPVPNAAQSPPIMSSGGSGSGSGAPSSGSVVGSPAVPSTTPGTPTTNTATSNSTTSNTATSNTATSNTATAGLTPGTTTSGGSIDPAAFGARMAVANTGVRSLVGSLSLVAGTTAEDGTFSETLSGGKISAIDMSVFVRSGAQNLALKVLIVDNKVYVGGSEIMTALNAGSRKWALAGPSSANATLRTIGTQLAGYLDSASANQYALYGQAARSVVDQGSVLLGTVRAHKYGLSVDVLKLAKLLPATKSQANSMQALADAGVTTIPTTIWLDASDRLVQVSSTVKLADISSATVFRVGSYNTSVVITAPAAADVFTG
jgi:hypothetical protein